MKVLNSLNKVLLILAIIILVLFNVISESNYSINATEYEDFKTKMDKQIPNLLNEHNVSGAAIALIHNGDIDWIKGYGWADKKNKIPVTENTVFQVASNSKTVAAWGVMKLVEENILDLDLPISEYLTRWNLPDSKYNNEKVTIRGLLSHTAGLLPISYAGYSPTQSLPSIEESLTGIPKGVRELKLTNEPGDKYRYSGGGYSLLQLIIEEVTGKPFSQYMEDSILSQLDMKSSSYKWKSELKNKTAKAYDILGHEMPNYIYTEEAAAGLYTTALDFARFVKVNIDIYKGYSLENSILKQESQATMYTPVDEDYGLGYIIKELPDKTRLIYHGGTNRGWRSQFAILPEMGEGLVVLTNSETGKSLHNDLVSIWTKWETGYTPKFYIKEIVMRILVKVIAMLVVLVMIVFVYQMFKDSFNKKRGLDKNNSKTNLMNIKKAVIISVLLLLFAVIWILVFYTGVLYNGWTFSSFMPSGFNGLTIVVLALVVIFNIRMFINTKVRINYLI